MQFLIPTSPLTSIKLIWLFSIVLLASPAWSVDLAAHVILAKGQVTAVNENGESRKLKRRSKIFNGDIIKTGSNGSVQLRFIDKALMTIKANSEMDIASYQQGGNGKEEKAIMNLVKGGFRTITGQIGKGDKSAYKVTTPAASIGIRGTNYEVQQEADGGFVMAVYSGGISVQNDSGTLDLGLGSDYNFVRVSSDSAPEGLLSAPESLSENAAAESTSDESDEESSDEQNEGDETASNNSEEDSDDDSSSESSDGDSENKTVIANDTSDNDGDSGSSDDSESDNPIEQAISAIQEELGELDEGTEEALGDVVSALDSQLVEQIEEDSETLADTLTQELVDAGLLTEGDSLSDLDPIVKENLENLGSIEDLEAALAEETDLTVEGIVPDPEDDSSTPPDSSTTDFITALYSDLPSVTNPFPTSIVSNQEFDLIASDKLAVMAIPINYTLSSSGSPQFQLMEAQLQSPEAVTTFNAYNFETTPSTISVYYEIIDLSSAEPTLTEYELRIPVDVSLGSINDVEYLLDNAINGGLVESTNGDPLEYFIDGQSTTLSGGPYGITLEPIYAADQVTITGFTVKPVSGSTEFITKMELQVHGGSLEAENALYNMIGGTGTRDDWYASADTELVISSGGWDLAATDGSGSPILYFERTETKTNEQGVPEEYTQIEAITKPLNSDETVGSLVSLGTLCGDTGIVCDIAVNTVKASDRIRWGAWLAEPGEGVNIYEILEDSQGFTNSSSHSDEQVLAFWLAAERADINQLTGTAQFTSTTNTNCTDFSQCIGFADDGVVQRVTGQFDVNFSNGAITNGNLNINVTDQPNLFTSSLATTTSEWDINFSGQIGADNPTEFTTNNVSGVVKDGAGNQISNQVIGNVGGIFVKPGDVFAGGYNVGTTDGTNKQAAGVFTLDKVSP